MAAAPAAVACGYHNPVDMARGMLNWAYPNALYVPTAVWKAQLDGKLSRDDRPAVTKALLGYGATVKDLGRLRDALALVHEKHDDRAISIVLIGPLLWARVVPGETGIELALHAPGPASGDAVLVTDEAVVKALVAGQLTPRAARDLGLIRLYGTPETVERAIAWLDRLNQPAIEELAKSAG